MQEAFLSFLIDKMFDYGRIWLGSSLVFGGVSGIFVYLFRFNAAKWIGSLFSIPLGLWILGDLERVIEFLKKVIN
jgi:hypothetical protein